MQLKHLVGDDRVVRVHAETDFVPNSFELGESTPRGQSIVARPKRRLRRKGKTYRVFGYLTSG